MNKFIINLEKCPSLTQRVFIKRDTFRFQMIKANNAKQLPTFEFQLYIVQRCLSEFFLTIFFLL